jgi:hypothetical protein
MDLLVFNPADAQPKSLQFDGPLSAVLAQEIKGAPEEVPGFNSVSQAGIVRKCVAYCEKDAKQNGRPVNTWATTLWHIALKRDGYDRGLRRADGAIADWLAGNVL